jgi:hypothetical protein
MNRYDWLTWALSLLVDKNVRDKAREELIALEGAVLRGEDKRKIIVNILLPGIVHGGVFLARALVELWLGQVRSQERG